VVAVAGRSLDKAKEFVGRFSIAKAYGSYEQLAQDNDVDIVYVGTIHPTHFDCCMKMFEHNKHVLCEKPMTMNADQTRKLIETARAKKLFLMEVSLTEWKTMYGIITGNMESSISVCCKDEGADHWWCYRRGQICQFQYWVYSTWED